MLCARDLEELLDVGMCTGLGKALRHDAGPCDE